MNHLVGLHEPPCVVGLPGGPVAEMPHSSAGALGSTPGQGTRSYTDPAQPNIYMYINLVY